MNIFLKKIFIIKLLLSFTYISYDISIFRLIKVSANI